MLTRKRRCADVAARAVADPPRGRCRAADADAAVFAENCVSCHGEQGEGVQELGGPALNDAIWMYGSEPAQIAAQIWHPRLGVMPNWQGRLDDTTIKMLTVYVHGLGGGQ